MLMPIPGEHALYGEVTDCLAPGHIAAFIWDQRWQNEEEVLQVTPIVARIPHPAKLDLQANDAEVAAIFHAPLELFLHDGPHHRHQDADFMGMPYRLHFFEHAGHTIWGLTAAFLINCAQVAFARSTAFVAEHPESRTHHP